MRCRVALGFLLALAPSPPGWTEELNVEGTISSYLARDLDGDGYLEILASYAEGGQRTLGVFRGGKSFAKQPDARYPVDPQAVAYTLADLGPDPGLELVLLSRSSVVAGSFARAGQDPGAGAREYQKLVDLDGFLAAPSRSAFPAWLARKKLDLDGDGRDDVVLPERSRLRILLGAPADAPPGSPFRSAIALPVAFYGLNDSREERLGKVVEDFAEEDKTPPPILEGANAFPYPLFVDFDGDGRLDVVVKQPGQVLEIFLQREPGKWDLEPSHHLSIPWAKKSSALELVDLNGDRKLDLVQVELALKDLATEIRVFIQSPGQPDLGFTEARQALRVQGFFRRPTLEDVNGDGRVDLSASPYRVDLLEKARSSLVEEVEMTHEVFLGTGDPPFERRPSYLERFLLRTSDLEEGKVGQPILAGRDFTGDGKPDLLFIDGGQSLRLYRQVSSSPLKFEESRAFAERVGDPDNVASRQLDPSPGEEVILQFKRRLEIRRGS